MHIDNNCDRIPRHVGIILDGNRRWAKKNNLPSLEGHRQGAQNFKEIAMHTFDRGVKYLSAYVFSCENWNRTKEETTYLMKLVTKAVEKYLDEFAERGIKIIVIGKTEGLSESVLKSINKTQQKTKDNKEGVLVLCFNYSGQQEIADAAKQIINKKINENEVTPELIEQNLYSPELPPLDLLIRTSGEQRLSGFMLWQSAYAELLFVDKLWPDFKAKDLDLCLNEYTNRCRRFGG